MNINDAPIEKSGDDLLGFGGIAKKLAGSILRLDTENRSFVVGVEGEWGSGKTSLLNLVIEQIKKENPNEEKAIIFHFNPWLVIGVENLFGYFFSELNNYILQSDYGIKNREQWHNAITKFAKSVIPSSLGINISGINVNWDFPKEANQNTLFDQKKKINEFLSQMPRKIIIVIDDIDRLTDEETEAVFRLVKGVADFKNIVYVLLYDKRIVAKSLENYKSENGEKYLDKIIQYGVTVPAPNRFCTFSEFNNSLKKIKNIIPETDYLLYQNDQYQMVFENSFVKHVKTLRALKKIEDIISFEYSQIKSHINIVDYIALTIIRVCNIKLYCSIKDEPNKYFYVMRVDYDPDTLGEDEYNKKIDKEFKEEREYEDYYDLVSIMFPAFSSPYIIPHEDKLNKIASIDGHNKYFQFLPPLINDDDYNNLKSAMFSGDLVGFENIVNSTANNQTSSESVVSNFYFLLDKHNEINSFSDNDMINSAILLTNLTFDVSGELGRQFLSKIIKDKNENLEKICQENRIPILIRLWLLIFYRERTQLELSGETLNSFTAELKNVTLKEAIQYGGDIDNYVLRDLAKCKITDSISREIKEIMFNSKDDFLKIIKLFLKKTQRYKKESYIPDKIDTFEDYIDLEKTIKYAKSLAEGDLTDEERAFIEPLLQKVKNRDTFRRAYNSGGQPPEIVA
ncbi:MAG: KAP family NTPase [Helicobacteraceae bacterium]|jgi:hypothetical protein|nr:KAP family NTPase [Helicobacteraceae bacterium]